MARIGCRSVAATAAFATTTATRARTVGAAETTILTAAFATATATATAITTTAAFTTATATTTAVATTATAAAITTTAAAAVATATTAPIPTTATGARGTGFHRAGFVHDDAATAQRLTVHAIDGSLRLGITAHFHETEALGAAGVALHHDLGTGHGAELAKRLLKIAIANRIRQVADVKFVAHQWDSSKHMKQAMESRKRIQQT
jgi:hypothetical protein